jgi:hypothetical protein
VTKNLLSQSSSAFIMHDRAVLPLQLKQEPNVEQSKVEIEMSKIN